METCGRSIFGWFKQDMTGVIKLMATVNQVDLNIIIDLGDWASHSLGLPSINMFKL